MIQPNDYLLLSTLVNGHDDTLVLDTTNIVEATNANETVLTPSGVPAVANVPVLDTFVCHSPAFNNTK